MLSTNKTVEKGNFDYRYIIIIFSRSKCRLARLQKHTSGTPRQWVQFQYWKVFTPEELYVLIFQVHRSCTEYFLTISVVCCGQPVITVTSLLWPFLSQKNAKTIQFSNTVMATLLVRPNFSVLGRINRFHCIRGGWFGWTNWLTSTEKWMIPATDEIWSRQEEWNTLP
jgi:hypothetical protein